MQIKITKLLELGCDPPISSSKNLIHIYKCKTKHIKNERLKSINGIYRKQEDE